MDYSVEDFKTDFVLNIDDLGLRNVIEKSVLEFSDNGKFTKREWNTYCRKLYIYCKESDYDIIEKNKRELYSIADKVHNVKNGHMLMEVVVVKKDFDGIFTSTSNEEVIIEEKLKFNKIDDCIGEGGFARVYKYRCPILNDYFAYKVLDPCTFNSTPIEIDIARFIREAKTLMKFNHPNIVKVYNIGKVQPNSYYIKMEWIDGNKLKDYINKNGPINIELFIHLSKQLLSAISYSHSFSILHRDLTERNIMITNDGILKVLDFGMAKNFKDGTDLTTLTNVINTDNMAPEIHETINNYSIKSDIYAIGCIMFRILANKTINIEFEKELQDLDIPISILNIIKKCIKVNVEDRYDNCQEIYNDLENYNSHITDVEQQSSTIFNLDNFRYLIENGISEIKVPLDFNNDFEKYKKFIEKDLIKVIQCNKFVSDISVHDIFAYFNYANISYYERFRINLIDLVKITDFYNSLGIEKDSFINTIKNIVDKKIKKELILDDDFLS